jgi:hypothetical protein
VAVFLRQRGPSIAEFLPSREFFAIFLDVGTDNPGMDRAAGKV